MLSHDSTFPQVGLAGSAASTVRHHRLKKKQVSASTTTCCACAKVSPKSHIYRILRSGEVRVNKGRIDQLYRLAEGDMVRIPPVRVAEKAAPTACPGPNLPSCSKTPIYW